jgi:hypothetical protein
MNTISNCYYENCKDDDGRTCACSHETLNSTSLMMKSKSSQMVSWVTMCSLYKNIGNVYCHWVYRLTIDVPSQITSCQMGRPNRLCNVEKKMSKTIWNDGMIGWIKKLKTQTQACPRSYVGMIGIFKTCAKWCKKNNFHAIFKKWSFENNLSTFLKIDWKNMQACTIKKKLQMDLQKKWTWTITFS